MIHYANGWDQEQTIVRVQAPLLAFTQSLREKLQQQQAVLKTQQIDMRDVGEASDKDVESREAMDPLASYTTHPPNKKSVHSVATPQVAAMSISCFHVLLLRNPCIVYHRSRNWVCYRASVPFAFEFLKVHHSFPSGVAVLT